MSTILAVSSSPRRGGNSELLLQSFSQGVQKEGGIINTIRISDLEFSPCTACDECAATGECVLQDDMQSIYPLVASATGLKMLIDRFQCWWHAKYRLDKPWVRLEEGRPGFFLCVGALKNKAYSESALAVAKVFFHNVNYRFVDSLCYRGIDAKGAIKEYPDALQSAYEAGRRFAVEA